MYLPVLLRTAFKSFNEVYGGNAMWKLNIENIVNALITTKGIYSTNHCSKVKFNTILRGTNNVWIKIHASLFVNLVTSNIGKLERIANSGEFCSFVLSYWKQLVMHFNDLNVMTWKK